MTFTTAIRLTANLRPSLPNPSPTPLLKPNMQHPYLFPADAHEGPVWVADQCRLYYATTVHLEERRVSIQYLDFSALGVCDGSAVWTNLEPTATQKVTPHEFVHDANMANSMILGPDGRSLLVAEQGDEQRPSVISRIDVSTGKRTVFMDASDDKPYNSLNKLVHTKRGHLVFSDPDYGFRQGFRPPPQREPALYVRRADGTTERLACELKMPHGLALTPDETTLFVTDTSNDGLHGDDVNLNLDNAVYRYPFDPASGTITGEGTRCFTTEKGVPDGMVVQDDRLLVAGGEGVLVADLEGNLIGRIPVPNGAVNLALAADGRHLFVTNDQAVLLFVDWRAFVRDKSS